MMNNAESELLYFNGIDGSTGHYLTPPTLPRVVSQIALEGLVDQQFLKDAKSWHYRSRETLRPKEGIDAKDLSMTGWGIIFAQSDERAEEIRSSLRALLDLRREQSDSHYREFFGEHGYQENESKYKFLSRHGAGPGPVDPEKIPYYLLIVASPEQIPYSFQYQLDLQYAVGRLHFETLKEYANYARTVVKSEMDQTNLPRRAVFFGVQNRDDRPTAYSTRELVQPLAASLKSHQKNWTVSTVVQEEATKSHLSRLLGGTETPALLFTASHGIGFSNGHPLQQRHQGGLICQDWPGPKGPVPTPEQYFSADDVTPDSVPGTIVFHFGCHTAGTPVMDDYCLPSTSEKIRAIAPKPFLASLPQRLLGHPNGGALAVVGHIERALGTSFLWHNTRQLQTFESALTALMDGVPIGSTLDYFNERFAEISADLSELMFEARLTLSETKTLPVELERSVAFLWAAKNDARGYVVIGDPAVRLSVR